MKLSIVIPVFDEERLILDVLRRVAAVPLDKELVVVNDCSRDGTKAVLDAIEQDPARVTSADPTGRTELRFFHQPVNRGKGAALHRGFAEARGEVVVVQDADLEYDPADWPGLLEPIIDGRADAVFGSRFMGGPHRVLYFWHSVGNYLLTLASNMFTNLNLTDMETCYKAIRGEVARSLKLTSDRFGFEPEVTARLAQANVRIFEVQISYSGRTYAEGKKIGWKDGVAAIRHIIKYNLFP
jgi:glycosyltransferase involved in cell wall biosynthesis